MKDRSNPVAHGLPKAVQFSGISPDPLPVQVLKSAAGYYLGTEFEGQPVSRESVDYYRSAGAAKAALDEGTWTARRDCSPPPREFSDPRFSGIPVRQGNVGRNAGGPPPAKLPGEPQLANNAGRRLRNSSGSGQRRKRAAGSGPPCEHQRVWIWHLMSFNRSQARHARLNE
jgi:hypothetical protein